MFPLEATGVDADAARNLTEIVAVALKQIDGASVVGLDDVENMIALEADRAALTCSADSSCLAEIGGALGVDKIVTGQVGKLGDEYVIGLRLLDREAAAVDHRVTESFVGSEEMLIRGTRHATRRLLGLTGGGTGQLSIASSVPDAVVFVDGVRRGRAPGPPIDDLTPGRHAVRVSAASYYDWYGDVYVDPSSTTAQWVVLEEEPALVRPFVPTWAFWGLTGVAGVAVAGSAALLVPTTWFVAEHNLMTAGAFGNRSTARPSAPGASGPMGCSSDLPQLGRRAPRSVPPPRSPTR